MHKIIAAAAVACLFAGAATAAEPALQVSYPTDGAMTCAQLATEIAAMDGVIGVSTKAVAGAQGSGRAAELGTSLAINGALYSGALGRVPGLGMFANAAGGMAKQGAAARQKAQEERIRTAETRRAMLMGMHAGKGCNAAPAVPAVAATPTTPAAPVASQTPTTQ